MKESGKWLHDQDAGIGISIKTKGEVLFREESPYQLVEIYDTEEYGRCLVLDGVINCTEKDEPAYHEMIAHVPYFSTADAVERVLIIGGGDGGTAREILRHASVQSVELVEIDALVVKAAEQFFPKQKAALQDSRLQVLCQDGIHFVKTAKAASYDLVIIDASDPIGPGEVLFSAEIYREIYRILKPSGQMVSQMGSPYYDHQYFENGFADQKAIYGNENVRCFLSVIPTYTGALWSYSLASKSSISSPNKEAISKFVAGENLNYYNLSMHSAAFALPEFVRRKLSSTGIT